MEKNHILLTNDSLFGETSFSIPLSEENYLQIKKSPNPKTYSVFISKNIKKVKLKVSDKLQFKIVIAMVGLFITHIVDYKTGIFTAKNYSGQFL